MTTSNTNTTNTTANDTPKKFKGIQFDTANMLAVDEDGDPYIRNIFWGFNSDHIDEYTKYTADAMKAEVKIGWAKIIIGFILGILIGAGAMWFYMHGEVNDLEEQVNNLKTEYATSIDEKEKALADLALEQLKEPEKIYIKGDTVVETKYVEKTSSDEADVDITNPPPTIKLAYNGKEEVLKMQTSGDSVDKNPDGSLKISQSSEIKLDVTDVVNREIANTILQKDSEIERLNHELKVKDRQNIQGKFWAGVAGIAVGAAIL